MVSERKKNKAIIRAGMLQTQTANDSFFHLLVVRPTSVSHGLVEREGRGRNGSHATNSSSCVALVAATTQSPSGFQSNGQKGKEGKNRKER